MIHESFRNHSRIVPALAYARGAGSREQGARERGNQSSICLSNWSARETPRMDGGFAAEIGGGRR